ncbi:hypothetical protein [Halovenus sp. HT40]|uniref:hypothetical protein n=1 Tax=Halovenus sp. HT40 TaxID=3126691 RepID=UPI00300EE5CC
MSITTSSGDRPPLVLGAVVGVGAWIIGYALLFLVVSPDIQDSFIQQFIEAVEGEPATYQMVGWVFYNAHFVDTVIVNVPVLGDQTANAIGGEDGFSQLLSLVPVGLLVAAGLGLVRSQAVSDVRDGLLVGATVLPGYLLLSALGLVLFEVAIGSATGRPAQVEAIVLAGIVYPLVFGSLGGALGAVTAE